MQMETKTKKNLCSYTYIKLDIKRDYNKRQTRFLNNAKELTNKKI